MARHFCSQTDQTGKLGFIMYSGNKKVKTKIGFPKLVTCDVASKPTCGKKHPKMKTVAQKLMINWHK